MIGAAMIPAPQDRNPEVDRASLVLSLLVLVVAIAARFHGLDRLGLWADELWVVMESPRGSLSDLLAFIQYHDNHPPGYYLLSRYLQLLAGASDFAIRLPSAIAGVLLVLLTLHTGRRQYSLEAGIIAAALVAGSWQAIYYSQEARPNIFVAVFALGAFHHFRAVLLDGDTALRHLLCFWLYAIGACSFHYAGVVFVACLGAIGLVLVLVDRDRARFLAGVKLFTVPLLAFMPWLPATWYQLHHTPVTGWQRPPTLDTLDQTLDFLLGPDPASVWFHLLAIAALMVLAGIALVKNRQALFSFRAAMLLYTTVLMLVLPVLVFFVKSRYSQDAYNHRHFLYVIPLAALLVGQAVSLLLQPLHGPQRHIALWLFVVMLLCYEMARNITGGFYTSNHFKQDYREAVAVYAEDRTTATAGTLVVSSTPFFDHYLQRTAGAPVSDFYFNQPEQLDALAQLLAEKHASGFYYLEAPEVPAANGMVTARDLLLAQHYQLECRSKLLRTQVFRFRINRDSHSIPDNLPACVSAGSPRE